MNICEFKTGDKITNQYTSSNYEVIEPNKNGMSKIMNLDTGIVETWNAYNNNHFLKSERNNYKVLSNYEKLEQIRKLSLCKHERIIAAQYLIILRSNDVQKIEDYESFGTSVRQMIMNRSSFERGLLFGFTSRKFDKYGWLERPTFLNYEKYSFPDKADRAVFNYVEIGSGINGMWTYGISHFFGISGISIWGAIFKTRKECLISALEKLQTILTNYIKLAEKSSDNHNKTSYKNVLTQVNEQLMIAKEEKYYIQLSLF